MRVLCFFLLAACGGARTGDGCELDEDCSGGLVCVAERAVCAETCVSDADCPIEALCAADLSSPVERRFCDEGWPVFR